MIAGTTFRMARFADLWPTVKDRARAVMSEKAVKDASLWNNVCLQNEDGMLVVTLTASHNGLRAFVTIAVSNGAHGAFLRNEAAMVEIARDMGAETLAFRSDRRGWRRLLGPKWRRDGDLYERRV
jgi:hypothetical protein